MKKQKILDLVNSILQFAENSDREFVLQEVSCLLIAEMKNRYNVYMKNLAEYAKDLSDEDLVEIKYLFDKQRRDEKEAREAARRKQLQEEQNKETKRKEAEFSLPDLIRRIFNHKDDDHD